MLHAGGVSVYEYHLAPNNFVDGAAPESRGARAAVQGAGWPVERNVAHKMGEASTRSPSDT